MMERIASAGTIRRADLELVRARLGIPDEGATLWDQLCDDLVAKSADIESEMKSIVQAAAEGRGMVERSQAIARRREAAETAWFDSVAAAFPSIPAEAIDAERGRRAVRRVIESGSLFLMQARMTGNRWIDADLDRAADACAHDARRAAAAPLADWRRAQVAAVGDLVACSERMVERMTAAQEAMQAAAADYAEGEGVGFAAFEGFQKAQTDYQRDVAEVARRAEAMQAASVQAVADAMPRPQAAVFRRSLRRQMHPEVYRDQDRVDAAIDSVLGDPSLSADQRGAVAAAWGESQTRFEAIAERLVAQSARNDRAMADMFVDMMGAAGSDGGPSDMERAATESDDLAFDQAELRARTVRRVRAAVGDRVADAHGVR
jgi:rubrerythrin